jgi:hypothetical protein
LVREKDEFKVHERDHLILLEPFFQKLFPALLQDRARELNGLQMIEISFLQENTEVLKNGRKAPRGSRCLFE